MPWIRRPALAALALASALTLTTASCGFAGGDGAGAPGQAGAGRAAPPGEESGNRLERLGVDLGNWISGAWKDWKPEEWLSGADDFINPVIDGLWSPDRMGDARETGRTVPADVAADQGVTDPVPEPRQAEPVEAPYRANAAPVGKVFFDGPEGSMVCSATVVRDPAHPGKSNMVWTAGHCAHAGKDGGWYRNIVFVPSFNDRGVDAAGLRSAPAEQVAPYGTWWADWAAASPRWISEGTSEGGGGAPYDFAVLHVRPPEDGDGRSLEETVGEALPVDFDAPSARDFDRLGTWGYPAAPPFDGTRMYSCADKPGRLSLADEQPTMYRIGCTMTGGASGGGWFARTTDGRLTLVSNTSIGPNRSTWLAGPRLGADAERMYDGVSRRFADR